MSSYRKFLEYIPEVQAPKNKQSLKTRLLWTFGILILFLFLTSVPLYGIDGSQAEYFKQLELLLGAKIGKLFLTHIILKLTRRIPK